MTRTPKRLSNLPRKSRQVVVGERAASYKLQPDSAWPLSSCLPAKIRGHRERLTEDLNDAR
eukprot:6044057-Heterocapsa_arctica.AAC.1